VVELQRLRIVHPKDDVRVVPHIAVAQDLSVVVFALALFGKAEGGRGPYPLAAIREEGVFGGIYWRLRVMLRILTHPGLAWACSAGQWQRPWT
jgi:hypothetical protein